MAASKPKECDVFLNHHHPAFAMKKHASFQRFGILTGTLLLLGFFLPIIIDFGEGEMIFPNITFLAQDLFPLSVRLYLVLPLLGGIACLVALVPSNVYVRAGLYFFAGFAPWLLEYFMTSELLSYSAGLNRGFLSGAQFSVTSLILGFLMRFGLVGMFAAAFAGRANPKAKVAHYFAMVGSVMVLVAMVFPVQSAGGRWSVLLAMPFETLGLNPLFGIILLLLFGLLMAAAILGILWGIGHQKGVNNAKSMKWLLLIALVSTLVSLFVVIYLNFPPVDRVKIGAFELFVGYLKVLGMFLAPVFAKCLGFMELIAYSPDKPGPADGEVKLNPSPAFEAAEPGQELPFAHPDSPAEIV
jgi:hypothetical protein